MRKFPNKYNNLFTKIIKYSNDLHLPTKYKEKNIKTNSWFKIKQFSYKNISEYDIKLKKSAKKYIIKCEKIQMFPTIKQKDILINWMNGYIKMYNETISLL